LVNGCNRVADQSRFKPKAWFVQLLQGGTAELILRAEGVLEEIKSLSILMWWPLRVSDALVFHVGAS
jgi:hypothetical protein